MNKINNTDIRKEVKRSAVHLKGIIYYQFIYDDGTEQYFYTSNLGLNMHLSFKSIYEAAKKFGYTKEELK